MGEYCGNLIAAGELSGTMPSLTWGMMLLHNSPEANVKLGEALRHMSDALFILDELDAPGEIGTGLDLAIAHLSQFLRQEPDERGAVHRMMRELEREFVAIRESHPSSPGPVKNIAGLAMFGRGTAQRETSLSG